MIAQRRQCWPPADKIWRKESAWMIGPVSPSVFTVEKDAVRRKDSRAKLVRAIGIMTKIAWGKERSKECHLRSRTVSSALDETWELWGFYELFQWKMVQDDLF